MTDHTSPQACSRCNPVECICECHSKVYDADTYEPMVYDRSGHWWSHGWRPARCTGGAA